MRLQLLSAAEGDKNNKLERRMVMLRTLLVTLQCAAGSGQVDKDSAQAEQGAGMLWKAEGAVPPEAFLPRQSSDGRDARAAVAEFLTISAENSLPDSLEIDAFVPVRHPVPIDIYRRDTILYVTILCWFATGALATSLAVLVGMLSRRPNRSGTAC